MLTIWLMLQQKKADDFVISTGVQHSVEDFAKLAFSRSLDYKKFIVDEKLFRPTETEALVGDSSYAKKFYGNQKLNLINW